MNNVTQVLLSHFETPTTKSEVESYLMDYCMDDAIYGYFVDHTGHANLNPDNFGTHPLYNDMIDDICFDLNIE